MEDKKEREIEALRLLLKLLAKNVGLKTHKDQDNVEVMKCMVGKVEKV